MTTGRINQVCTKPMNVKHPKAQIPQPFRGCHGLLKPQTLTEPSDEFANKPNSPVRHDITPGNSICRSSAKERNRLTVDYPEGINTHKTHRWPARPRAGG